MRYQIGNTAVEAADVLGGNPPSVFFPAMRRLAGNLLSGEKEKMLSRRSMTARRLFHPILMRMVPLFMEYRQVFESKNKLLGIDLPDTPMDLPKEAVIWCSNHRFKDDIAASIHAARHAYVLLGSIPVFYNTVEGISAWINGVVLCNRKQKQSRHAAAEACKEVLRMGTDLIIFPEGVWNKTPEKLLLDFWPGVYRIAAETGAPIVPVIHYLADPQKKYKGNVIHTVIADPIRMDGLTEKEGLALLRDIMAGWYYLLMERYGQTTREELLQGCRTLDEAWESYLRIHTGQVAYYDKKIECRADYLVRDKVRPADVWAPVAEINTVTVENAAHIAYASALVESETKRNVQRRY